MYQCMGDVRRSERVLYSCRMSTSRCYTSERIRQDSKHHHATVDPKNKQRKQPTVCRQATWRTTVGPSELRPQDVCEVCESKSTGADGQTTDELKADLTNEEHCSPVGDNSIPCIVLVSNSTTSAGASFVSESANICLVGQCCNLALPKALSSRSRRALTA